MKIKNILISQPEPVDLEKTPYYTLSKKYKTNFDFRKFIKIEGVDAIDFRKDKIRILDYTAVIFTSRNAIDHYFRMAEDMRIKIPITMKYFCSSEAIALYLQKYITYRKRKVFYGKGSLQSLLDVIMKHKTDSFLIPCSNIYKKDLPNMLEEKDIKFTNAVLFKTLPQDISDLDINAYQMIVFFSPIGVESLFANFPDYKQEDTLMACFGPMTAQAIEDAGLRLDIKAPTTTAPSMTMAIEEVLKQK